MKKEVGTFLVGAAMVLEGCSGISSPSQKPIVEDSEKPNSSTPIDNIVNCQTNPLDDAGRIYSLKKGEIVRIGGITKNGDEDLVEVISQGEGNFIINPEKNEFQATYSPSHALILSDSNLYIILIGKSDKSTTSLGVSVTCNDALPSAPQA